MKANSVSSIFTSCLDRDSRTCQDCGSTTSNLEVHHILPVSQGGTNILDNLKTVCADCHKENYKYTHYPKDKSKLIPFDQREKSRHGVDKDKNTQILVTFPNKVVEQIEKYWHDKKLKSRSEAIRELIDKGLESR